MLFKFVIIAFLVKTTEAKGQNITPTLMVSRFYYLEISNKI